MASDVHVHGRWQTDVSQNSGDPLNEYTSDHVHGQGGGRGEDADAGLCRQFVKARSAVTRRHSLALFPSTEASSLQISSSFP